MKKILFVCAENAGRSQMAEAFFNHYAKEKGLDWTAESAGTIPTDKVNPLVVQAMANKGFDLKNAQPKLFNYKKAAENDLIISFGCLVKSVFPKKIQAKIDEWHIDDPNNKPLPQVEKVRDEVENKVLNLINTF